MKICSKFTGEHPCGSLISIKLENSFIEITFQHECSAVNLLHIFGTFFIRTPLEECFWKQLNQLLMTQPYLPYFPVISQNIRIYSKPSSFEHIPTNTFGRVGVIIRSSRPDVFLGKGFLKICSKFTGEHPCRSAISIKLKFATLLFEICNFKVATLLKSHFGMSILLHILRKP